MIRVSPREIDLAGFPVRRLLPTRQLRSVGPWIFFDHMGPHTFPDGAGVDVIPHPHIGLATVTYLFEGEIVHRDSLGTVQPITPGAINLMIAGSGIAHSERTDPSKRNGATVHGLQLWLALPADREEDAPSFEHTDASGIPEMGVRGGTIRVLMGSAFGLTSPVTTVSESLYVEASLEQGASLKLPSHEELCIYGITGALQVVAGGDGREPIGPGILAAVSPGSELIANEPCRVVVLGGAPIGKRYMWWNFVSSRIDRIEQAKEEWASGGFGTVVGDQHERAPLPESDGHSRMKP